MRGWNLALDSLVEYKLTNDIEKVVRCYQCKYHTTDDECTNPHWDKDELIICPKALDMDYCSYGDRKNG